VRPFGLVQSVTSTNIAGSADVVSTQLGRRFSNDDVFNGWFFTVVSDVGSVATTPSNGLGTHTQRVTNYVGSSSTLTLATTDLVAEDESVNFDLCVFHPDDIERAYNKARQNVFERHIGIIRDTETVVMGQNQILITVPSSIRKVQRIYIGDRLEAGSYANNLVLNGDFEDWTNDESLDNWSVVGSGGTVNQEQQTTSPANYLVLEGSNSARVHRAASTLTTLRQRLNPAQSVAIESVELNFSIWVYCADFGAGTVQAEIAGAGVTDAKGTAHDKTGWERLRVSTPTEHDAAFDSNITVGISIAASSSTAYDVYVDEAICVAGPNEIAEAPWIPLLDYEVLPPVGGASNKVIRLKHAIPDKRRLRIVGLDELSVQATEATTVEIDGDLLEPLYDLMRFYLCQERASAGPTGKTNVYWAQKAAEFRQSYEGATLRLALEMPGPRMRDPAVVY
jgi:hypothetical protein